MFALPIASAGMGVTRESRIRAKRTQSIWSGVTHIALAKGCHKVCVSSHFVHHTRTGLSRHYPSFVSGHDLSKPILHEASSSSFIIPANQLVGSIHGGSVHRKPTEGSHCPHRRVHELQYRHLLVHIVLVARPLLSWIVEVRAWTPIDVRSQNVPYTRNLSMRTHFARKYDKEGHEFHSPLLSKIEPGRRFS